MTGKAACRGLARSLCAEHDRQLKRKSRSPYRAAAVLPVVLAVLPRLVAGFAGARKWCRPSDLAGVEVGRFDESADAEFAARGPHDRKIADDQGCDIPSRPIAQACRNTSSPVPSVCSSRATPACSTGE
jgi:hypothetical protein